MEPVMRRGRKKKKINFNPDQEFLSNAIETFLKKGGRITKVNLGLPEFINPYRSESALGMESLPMEFI